MPPSPPRRYPLQPLLDAVALRPELPLRRVGLTGSTLKMFRERGLLAKSADMYAGRIGVHPASLWPSWFDDYLADHGRDCAERTCDRRFVPARKDQRFCSRPCNKRHHDRLKMARYRAKPAVRKRINADRRAYYAECAEYEKAAFRRRYAADPERERKRSRDNRAKARAEREAARRAA